MVEYLGLADYLLIAEAVLGVPAEVLALSTDLHLADSALNAPAASFGGHELRPSFAQKAAVLCIRVCNNHPLVDGNKRVAYQCSVRSPLHGFLFSKARHRPNADLREQEWLVSEGGPGGFLFPHPWGQVRTI